MKIFKALFFFILAVLVACLVYVLVQPDSFNFSRSRFIKAPTQVVFNKVNNFHEWPKFSPWLEKEPRAKTTFNAIPSGKGSTYGWEGELLGKGNMKILKTNPNQEINMAINFLKPFKSTANINWTFEPANGGTKVTWQMDGKQGFSTKMYTAFAGSIEENSAPDFNRGLAKLDSISVVEVNKHSITDNGLIEHGGGFYIYNTASTQIANIENKIRTMMPKVVEYATKNNISASGAPFIIYHKWDEKNGTTIFSCAIPTADRVISTDNDILSGFLKPFKATKTTLKGNYSYSKNAWEQAFRYLSANQLEMDDNGISIEAYPVTPSTDANPANWKTEIFIQVK